MGARLLAAVALSALIIVSAPYVGEIREAIRSFLPGQYVAIIAAVVAASLLAAVGVAVLRIRDRRLLRYSAVAAALVIGTAYAYLTRTGNVEIDAVERFHFVEYGVLALFFYWVWNELRDARVLVLPLAAGMIVAAADEWFQWFIPSRVGELRDVLLDGVAVLCGLLFAVGIRPPERLSWPADTRGRASIASAITAVAAAVATFVTIVHMGTEIRDAEIGVFRSRFSKGDLAAISKAREGGAWPGQTPRISREDQYLAEALWHVQRRNEAIAAKDPTSAWKENRILEKFFAPVLLLSEYRWSPELRDATFLAVVPGRDYVSDAEVFPIHTWPRWILWLGAAAIVAVAWIPVRT
jgi:VanZ family protein